MITGLPGEKIILPILISCQFILIQSCKTSTPRFQTNSPIETALIESEPRPLPDKSETDGLGYAIYNEAPKDVVGSKDHYLVRRFPGSLIMAYQAPRKGNMILPMGLITDGKFFKSKTVQGNITSLLYQGPKESQVGQIFKTYELELKKMGFDIVFKCQGNSCQDYTSRDLFAQTLYKGTEQTNLKLPVNAGLKHTQHFLSAEKERGSVNTYLTLMVKEGWWDSPAFRIDIAEN